MNILVVGDADQMLTEWLISLNLYSDRVAVLMVSCIGGAVNILDSGLSADILLLVNPDSPEAIKSDIDQFNSLASCANKTQILVLQNRADMNITRTSYQSAIGIIEKPEDLIKVIRSAERKSIRTQRWAIEAQSLRGEVDPENVNSRKSPYLTPRQSEVLIHVNQGKSNKEIARDLELTEGTVKVHCKAIFRALGVVNRTQAAVAYSDQSSSARAVRN